MSELMKTLEDCRESSCRSILALRTLWELSVCGNNGRLGAVMVPSSLILGGNQGSQLFALIRGTRASNRQNRKSYFQDLGKMANTRLWIGSVSDATTRSDGIITQHVCRTPRINEVRI